MALQILSGKRCHGSSPPICIYPKFAHCQDNFGKLIIHGKKPNQTDHNSWQRANLFLCKQHRSCNSPIWSFWRNFIKNIYVACAVGSNYIHVNQVSIAKEQGGSYISYFCTHTKRFHIDYLIIKMVVLNY